MKKGSPFQSLLVANRGEIAIRILRTARERGLRAIGVYSEADVNALHRFEADEALCIGPAESQKSYLSIEAILEAARKSKAEAIHPGYGFLSENASFARAVENESIIFVGPTAQMIETMGDKVRARQCVAAQGVPVVPGTEGLTDTEAALKAVSRLERERSDFCYPLLIKAAGGGGGKGMRIVRKPEDLKENLERAQSESLKAFNNPMVFVERYIEEPRHIEVQIMGDGNHYVHLYERECSLQRRHQKVVEEAPSPSISSQLREAIVAAALKAAQSVRYTSVGTVEFIVAPNDDFFFLEMNTRIQVEHPVSEWITGTDILRHQLDLAMGHSLKDFETPAMRGHSIEVRLYAEDTEHGFIPQPGRIHRLHFPSWAGIRVETSVESGSLISSFYDPMIAKISCWAPSRQDCRLRLAAFLKSLIVEGVVTNRIFLIDILESDFFKSGRFHTHQLESIGWRASLKHRPTAKELAMMCLKDHLNTKVQTKSHPLSTWQTSLELRGL